MQVRLKIVKDLQLVLRIASFLFYDLLNPIGHRINPCGESFRYYDLVPHFLNELMLRGECCGIFLSNLYLHYSPEVFDWVQVRILRGHGKEELLS